MDIVEMLKEVKENKVLHKFRINRVKFIDLLTASKRVTYVGGSKQPQCYGCMIEIQDDSIVITSTVRDGVTSVHQMVAIVDEVVNLSELGSSKLIPIPSIIDMLGILKSFKDETVTLTYKGESGNISNLTISTADKPKDRSSVKTTSLKVSPQAKAYPSSRNSILEQHTLATGIMDRCTQQEYTDKSGKKHIPCAGLSLDRSILLDAIRDCSVNGQNLTTVTLKTMGGRTVITGGLGVKGVTTTMISDVDLDVDFEFGGGIDNILNHFSEDLCVFIYDLREFGGKYLLYIDDINGNKVVQVGVPDDN